MGDARTTVAGAAAFATAHCKCSRDTDHRPMNAVQHPAQTRADTSTGGPPPSELPFLVALAVDVIDRDIREIPQLVESAIGRFGPLVAPTHEVEASVGDRVALRPWI